MSHGLHSPLVASLRSGRVQIYTTISWDSEGFVPRVVLCKPDTTPAAYVLFAVVHTGSIGVYHGFLAAQGLALGVSDFVVTLCMAVRVSRKFFSVVGLSVACFRSRVSLYAVACVRVNNFAPWMSNSSGISRFMGSGRSLFAPCFASASLASLPWTPSWPLTYCRVILADLCLMRCAVFRKCLAFDG